MKKYEILEHTADLKIKVYGQDLVELFINAAIAMADQQKPGVSGQEIESEWEVIEVESPDKNSLLVDWLSEILSLSDINKKVYLDFQIEELSHTHLKAKIKGLLVKEKDLDIKAATYHDLEVKKVNNHWQAVIIFDI